MPNGFEPSNSFEGYVYAKLESINERLDVLPCDEQSKRLGKCENDISNIKGKATILGAVMGFVAGIIGKVFWGK